ncbi:MAG TPA: SAM-dependent chlorinase/fluorinase [Tepidisphaeraceae bacterium]
MTLTSDFGMRDFYVAAMKAALMRHAPPDVRMIDVTHEIPRHDILCGAITLERAVDGFLPGTVHLAVVDPGVGTARRILVVQMNRQTVVCPDNGLITWAWRRLGPSNAFELTWRPKSASNTFHGRDIMAPAAGMLAAGTSIEAIARPITDPILLDIAPAAPGSTTARIIHVDAFGNATTNMDYATLRARGDRTFRVAGRNLGPLRRTYQDVAPGEPLALIGSSGLLEIAVRDGAAKELLNLKVGDEVILATPVTGTRHTN